MAEEKKKKMERAKGIGSSVGRGVAGFLRSADKALDKVGFPRMDPMRFVGGGRSPVQKPVAPSKVMPAQTQQRELAWCPVCFKWVPTPHRHKVIETR